MSTEPRPRSDDDLIRDAMSGIEAVKPEDRFRDDSRGDEVRQKLAEFEAKEANRKKRIKIGVWIVGAAAATEIRSRGVYTPRCSSRTWGGVTPPHKRSSTSHLGIWGLSP